MRPGVRGAEGASCAVQLKTKRMRMQHTARSATRVPSPAHLPRWAASTLCVVCSPALQPAHIRLCGVAPSPGLVAQRRCHRWPRALYERSNDRMIRAQMQRGNVASTWRQLIVEARSRGEHTAHTHNPGCAELSTRHSRLGPLGMTEEQEPESSERTRASARQTSRAAPRPPDERRARAQSISGLAQGAALAAAAPEASSSAASTARAPPGAIASAKSLARVSVICSIL